MPCRWFFVFARQSSRSITIGHAVKQELDAAFAVQGSSVESLRRVRRIEAP
jgi:TolB-like protein